MKNSTHHQLHPATREKILQVFQDSYRTALAYDPEAEPDVPIRPETTVAQLGLAFDWGRAKKLGPALGTYFGVDATRDEWLKVLTPGSQRTLADVCDFLVKKGARLPASEPIRIFGTECDSAGAFLTLRSLLAEEGINVSDLRPSSGLAAFVKKKKRLHALLLVMNKLAPGVLPEPLIRHNVPKHLETIFVWLFIVGTLGAGGVLVVLLGGELVNRFGGPANPEGLRPYLLLGPASLFGISLVGSYIAGLIWPSEHIARPGLETFADLARAVAAYERPTSGE